MSVHPFQDPPAYRFTHCALRLGDNLAHLHFLRKMSQEYRGTRFIHFAHLEYISQLETVISDLPRLALLPLLPCFPGGAGHWNCSPPTDIPSINAWKNCTGFYSRWHQKGYSTTMLEWFEVLANEMGYKSPLRRPEDLLFDYPALKRPLDDVGEDNVLFINSAPQSGQLGGFSADEIEKLGLDLFKAWGPKLITTAPLTRNLTYSRAGTACTALRGLSVTSIGRLSLKSKFIVGIGTGPLWPTLNVWNAQTMQARVHLCDEHIDVPCAKDFATARTYDEARAICRHFGILPR